MDPRTAARIIGEHFHANAHELEFIERVIRWTRPRSNDPDATPVRAYTDPRFPPPAPCAEPGKDVK